MGERTFSADDFCQEFIKHEKFSTSQEADIVLTSIITVINEYRRKPLADQALERKLKVSKQNSFHQSTKSSVAKRLWSKGEQVLDRRE